MKSCEQTQEMNVLQHGLSVNKYFHDLKDHIINGSPLIFEWKLPEWINNPKIWLSLTTDDEGKRHFPEHAKISGAIWRQIGGTEIQAQLIERDMDIHLLKMDDFDQFFSQPFATTLLITALCEIHSNASMFGGIESTSFKIKWKKINKIGKKINELLGE